MLGGINQILFALRPSPWCLALMCKALFCHYKSRIREHSAHGTFQTSLTALIKRRAQEPEIQVPLCPIASEMEPIEFCLSDLCKCEPFMFLLHGKNLFNKYLPRKDVHSTCPLTSHCPATCQIQVHLKFPCSCTNILVLIIAWPSSS